MAEIIPATRRYPWAGNVGVPGGIPTVTTIFVNMRTTTDPAYLCAADGINDDSPQIRNALTACPAGQVVYLPAGTYAWANPIVLNTSHSGMILRGDGIGQTIIKGKTVGQAVLLANGSWDGGPDATSYISAGATMGSTVVTIPDASGFVVGNNVLIRPVDQPTYVHNLNNSGTYNPSMGWVHRIVSTTSTTVTFAPPLALDISANTPVLEHLSQTTVTGIGIENLSVDMSDTGWTNGWFWTLQNARGCWMQNVELYGTPSHQIYWADVIQSEIRKCIFRDNRAGGPGHEGVDLATYACWNLLEDNILSRAGFPQIMISDSGVFCGGNVISSNFFNRVNVGASDTSGADFGFNHGAHPSFNLCEGNVLGEVQSDGYFGSSSHNTIFRNWITVTHETAIYGLRGVDLNHYSNYFNVVGNVIGTPSFSGQFDPGSPYVRNYNDAIQLIQRLGMPNLGNTCFGLTGVYSSDIIAATTPPNYGAEPYILGNCGVSGAQSLDLNVKATTAWHGNYDYLSAAILWAADDANVIDHTDHAIPDSCLYSSRPSWFVDKDGATMVWPPVDPASPKGAFTAATAAATIPAASRYYNLSGGGGGPPAPTAARIILR